MILFDLPPAVGVAGVNGSGKTTLGAARQELADVPYADLSDFARDEARKLGLNPSERGVLGPIIERWAKEKGNPAFMAQVAFEGFEAQRLKALEAGIVLPEGFTAVSIRRPAEAQFIQNLGGALIWVDAPLEVRLKRINDRARDEGDIKTPEQFMAEEAKEMFAQDPSDPYQMNMSRVKEMADFTYENMASDREEAITHMAETFGLPTKK